MMAEIVDEHDTRLWRVLDHYVSWAVEGLDLSEVEQIAADETSARRGHDYIIFIERLWRSIKYEEVHFKAYVDGREARISIGQWMEFYNHRRPH
jgi:transposase InsO family protein